MTDHATVYDVRKRTGNPEDASIDTVCERLLERAATPQANHLDAHLDTAIATVVNRYEIHSSERSST